MDFEFQSYLYRHFHYWLTLLCFLEVLQSTQNDSTVIKGASFADTFAVIIGDDALGSQSNLKGCFSLDGKGYLSLT